MAPLMRKIRGEISYRGLACPFLFLLMRRPNMSASHAAKTLAQQLKDQSLGADWHSVLSAVTRLGGVRRDSRGDDRWIFPDGSSALVRGLTFVAGNYSFRRESTLPVVDLDSPEPPLFRGDILSVIPRLQFVFAKTMPDVPHEYTLRLRTENDADYVALYDAIMHNGIIAFWHGRDAKFKNSRPARYLQPGDGWWYWSMSPKRTVPPYEEGRHPLFLSHHINRCTHEAWDNQIERGWTSIALRTEEV